LPFLRRLALAAGTLTVVRVPYGVSATPEELRRSAALYPLVGWGVGAVAAVVLLLPLPPLPRAALALAAWVVVTGALHLDGWADCCDAAFAPPLASVEETRARRLAILKDPHLGTFGTVGLILLLIGKCTALAYVPAFAPLVAAPVGRWVMTGSLRFFTPARPGGLAAAFAGRAPAGAAVAWLCAVLLITIWSVGEGVGVRVMEAAAAGVLGGIAVAAALARRFGGVTGDVCGAAGEAAELLVLLALLPWGAE
jgi:adenosylcobinamide-GDP ribazoletransferase